MVGRFGIALESGFGFSGLSDGCGLRTLCLRERLERQLPGVTG